MIILKSRLSSLIIVFYLVIVLPCIVTATATQEEYPDIFSRENIAIAPNESIGRLLVTGADVIISGKVTEGILLVDGNLTIMPDAKVSGKILVIGGNTYFSPEAELNETPWVILPQGFSLAPILVGTLITLSAISLVVMPLAALWVFYMLKRLPFYNRINAYFLKIQRHHPAAFITASLFLSACMLVVFAELAWETIFKKTTAVFDNVIFWLVRYFAGPAVDKVMIFITGLGSGIPYFVIVTIVFLLLGYLKRWLEMGGMLICLAGGVILNEILNYLFERSRPDLLRIVEAVGYSFPSGHAMVSLCFYGMIAFFIIHSLRNHWAKLIVLGAAIVLIAAIGASRVYLGVHYPTDVVAGYAASSVWVSLCISLLLWWEKE